MRISIQDAGTCDSLGIEQGYDAIREAGFEAIDWNIDHALRADMIRSLNYRGNCIFEKSLEEVLAYYAEELAIIRKNGLAITQCHAPFPAYVPGHPELMEYMIGIYCRCIEFCDAVGIPRIVIHGNSLSHGDVINTEESIEQLNRRLFESLIPTLQRCNVTVCMENLCTWTDGVATQGTCCDPHEACRLIDSLNEKAGKECFGLCMDVGHFQLVAGNIRTYAPILGSRIKCLHIHDNNAHADQHVAPFTGTTNWNHVCQTLREIGYKGDLSFETVNQTRKPSKFDKDLVRPWLNLIYATGVVLRKHILE